jgi:hypothetical protein
VTAEDSPQVSRQQEMSVLDGRRLDSRNTLRGIWGGNSQPPAWIGTSLGSAAFFA